jgi:uncharacterized repeat protein (TIGR03843 family)
MIQQLDKQVLLEYLETAPCVLTGQFLNGSNYTFFVSLATPAGEMQAVYKPVRGEAPLWDFPTGSLAKREVAAYILSEALGWHIVPPTVFRRKGLPFRAGSVQQFIEHDPEHHYFNLNPEEKERLRPVALFDLLINNADRKGSHILWSENNHLYCIDHGVCFHKENKLRTVIWDFAGQSIPEALLGDLDRLSDQLKPGAPDFDRLAGCLRKGEIKAINKRAEDILKHPFFPNTDKTRRQFPWPPV